MIPRSSFSCIKSHTGFAVAFIAAFVLSVPSRADSDGYFCASKGYLAYELREGITPGESLVSLGGAFDQLCRDFRLAFGANA
jgi:hypothetical protein